MNNIKRALKVFLVNFIFYFLFFYFIFFTLVNFTLMPGMCSVLLYAFDTYMQDNRRIGFRGLTLRQFAADLFHAGHCHFGL